MANEILLTEDEKIIDGVKMRAAQFGREVYIISGDYGGDIRPLENGLINITLDNGDIMDAVLLDVSRERIGELHSPYVIVNISHNKGDYKINISSHKPEKMDKEELDKLLAHYQEKYGDV